MKSRIDRRSIFKLTVILTFAIAFAVFSFLGTQQRALASAFGPTPSHTGAPLEANCTACHGDFPVNKGEGSVEITGVPSTYAPGQQFNITVTARQADAVIYGFQLTAIDATGQKVGTYTIPAAEKDRIQILQGVVGKDNLFREYVEHTSGGLTNGQFGFNSWTFQWKAPEQQPAGPIGFYAAANAANSDGSPGGDQIYTASVSTSPASASAFSISGRVFTPTGVAIRNARVVLTLPDGTQRAAFTSSFGNYSFPDLPGDAEYTLGVQSRRYRFAPRVLTLNANAANVDFTGLE